MVNNLKERLAEFQESLLSGLVVNGDPVVRFECCPDVVRKLRQVLSSYLGHFKHADTWNLQKALFASYPWLSFYFRQQDGRLIDIFKPVGEFHFFYQQVDFFKRGLGSGLILLVQVGAYYEIYDDDAVLLAAKLGLHKRYGFRGMAVTCGRPVVAGKILIGFRPKTITD